jgi:hypothetical protein
MNDELSNLMPLKTKIRVDDGTNLSMCNFNADPSEGEQVLGVEERKPLIQYKKTLQQHRAPSAPNKPPPGKN